MEIWNGFKKEVKELFGRELIIVYPEKPNGRWVLKTEYFNAFPETEIKLVQKGYHLVHIKIKQDGMCGRIPRHVPLLQNICTKSLGFRKNV